MGFVYLVTNLVNNNQYVGKTLQTVLQRWGSHRSSARRGSSLPIHAAIRKYGENAFSIVALEEVVDPLTLALREVFWIAYYNTFNRENGYNLTIGGDGSPGVVPSIEHRQKISKANTGKRHTDATKEKIRAANLGHKLTQEQQEKHRVAQEKTRGRPRRKWTEEQRRKLSATKKGQIRSPEHSAAISRGKKGQPGHPLSSEAKAKLSAFKMGHQVSQETRNKISETKRKKREQALLSETKL